MSGQIVRTNRTDSRTDNSPPLGGLSGVPVRKKKRKGERAMSARIPATIKARILDARERCLLLHLQLYCEADGCPAREIDVFVKDFDRALEHLQQFHCP